MAKGVYYNSSEFNVFKRLKIQFYFYKHLLAIFPELEIAWSNKYDKKMSFKFIISFEWLMFGFWIKLNK